MSSNVQEVVKCAVCGCSTTVAVPSSFPVGEIFAYCDTCRQQEIEESGGTIAPRAVYLAPPNSLFPSQLSVEAVLSPGFKEAAERNAQKPSEFLDRHMSGDMGERFNEQFRQDEPGQFNAEVADHEAVLSNHQGLVHGIYRFKDGTELWVMTNLFPNPPQAQIEFLLPEEY